MIQNRLFLDNIRNFQRCLKTN